MNDTENNTYAENLAIESAIINADINKIGLLSHIEKTFKSALPEGVTVNNRLFITDKTDTTTLDLLLENHNILEQEEIYAILESDPDGFEKATKDELTDIKYTNTKDSLSANNYYPIAPTQGFYFETYEQERKAELGLNDTEQAGNTPYLNSENEGLGDYTKREARIQKCKKYYDIEEIVLTKSGTLRKTNKATGKVRKQRKGKIILSPKKALSRATATAKREGKQADKAYIAKLVAKYTK